MNLFLGDTPFFYPEYLNTFLAEPYAWTTRGINLGGASQALWLSPLMFLWGLLKNNTLAVQLLFYGPSLVFSILGIWLLARKFKFSGGATFLATLFYLLNTYFLTIVDGGVLGLILAYGFFPLALWSLLNLLDNYKARDYLVTIILVFLLTVADPRVTILAFLLTVILGWSKQLPRLIPVVIATVGLSGYWFYPLLTLGGGSALEVFRLGQNTWINSVTLYVSHFPINEFGQTTRPPLYYVLLPILIFTGAFLSKKLKSVVGLLVFVFLAKGATQPFGWLYEGLLRLPFASAFRDSTKFFIPLMLLGGISLGFLFDKGRFKHVISFLFLCLYLLFLVSPVWLGKMNFVLSGKPVNDDYGRIAQEIRQSGGETKTVWFPEKHPLGYFSTLTPALNGRDLVTLSPLAQLNVGNHPYNFINNPKYLDYLSIFGVKYLLVDDDFRKASFSENDLEDKAMLLDVFGKDSRLKKVDWGASVAVFENKNVKPLLYAVDKINLVVGKPVVEKDQDLFPSIYLEDGKWDPRLLEGKIPSSVQVVFNQREKNDFVMGFLQTYFYPVGFRGKSNWSNWKNEDYLKYKWELLIRGVEFHDFDYQQGLAFSEVVGETVEFNLPVTKKGSYLLFVRVGGQVEITASNLSVVGTEKTDDLRWIKVGELSLVKGKLKVTATNKGGVGILNTVALVPLEEYNRAQRVAFDYLDTFKTDPNKQSVISVVDYSFVNPTKINLTDSQKPSWVIFSESYHSKWQLHRGTDFFASVPVYSTINGFYYDPKWGEVTLEFVGQKNIRWGLYYSLVSFLVTSILLLYFYDSTSSSGTIK